jgi:hypothetical protein
VVHLTDRRVLLQRSTCVAMAAIWPFLNVVSGAVVPEVITRGGLLAAIGIAGSMSVFALPFAVLVLAVARAGEVRRVSALTAVLFGVGLVEAGMEVAILWLSSWQCWSPICGN